MCFQKDGNDLVMTRIGQIDFRDGENEPISRLYIKAQEVKGRYWQQDLEESVNK